MTNTTEYPEEFKTTFSTTPDEGDTTQAGKL